MSTRKEKLAAQIETLKARIAKDTEALAQSEATFGQIDALENLAPGSTITARVGRGDTSKEVEAYVLGIKDTDAGRRIKVSVGSGFDAEIVIIQETQIVSVGAPQSPVEQVA